MLQDFVIQTNLVPDTVLRKIIQILLKGTLKKQERIFRQDPDNYLDNYIQSIKSDKIAVDTSEANEQHYEVPVSFYKQVLGAFLKYSCGYWENNTRLLQDAERNMLDMYIDRAQIKNGMTILDLGCGWGSLSLYLASSSLIPRYWQSPIPVHKSNIYKNKPKRRGCDICKQREWTSTPLPSTPHLIELFQSKCWNMYAIMMLYSQN